CRPARHRPVGNKAVLPPAQQSVLRTDPKIVLEILGDREAIVTGHLRCTGAIENRHPNPIKTRQTRASTNPNVTITRLDQTADGVLWKPGLSLPLRHTIARFYRCRHYGSGVCDVPRRGDSSCVADSVRSP